MTRVKIPLLTVNAARLRQWLPPRAPESHKGDYGRVLLLCGAEGYTGAPVLAARAALRTGAGLVFVGVPRCVYPIVAAKLTEAMVFPLPDRDGKLSAEAVAEILPRLEKMDACLIGCGLGQSADVRTVVEAVLTHAKCPVVVDADGINVLSGHIDIVRGVSCPVVLTPHDGEFARLGGDLGQARPAETRRMQRLLGATLLRKGHRTLICGEKECYVNRCGNPGMATGGSGDALAGILVSLLGQGLTPVHAAAAAAWLHGTAGDLCARRLSEAGMLPTDLIETLPRLL